MSVSELYDHGQSHPTANMRFNNVTTDGSPILQWPLSQLTPAISVAKNIIFTGTLRTTGVGLNTVKTYPLPASPPFNTGINIKFRYSIKGGVIPLTNQNLYREAWILLEISNGVVAGPTGDYVVNQSSLGGLAGASVGHVVTVVAGTVIFQLQDVAGGGRTFDWAWSIVIDQITTTL